MLAFFRRILSSGVAVAILGVIMLAFVVTGIGTPGGGFGGLGGPRGDAVATVGGKPLLVADVATRAQQEQRLAAQQQPGLTMTQFLAAVGGAPALVEQMISQQVLVRWAEKHGVAAGKRLVDGEIASIPAFFGPAGQFDEQQMRSVLAQQRMSYPALRDSVTQDLIRRQLVVPLSTGARAPQGLLEPYAALLLDRREGAIGLVPADPVGIAAPTDAEVQAWYGSHLARYSLPDRRVVRYAAIGPDTVTVAAPTDAEIAAAYKANAATYAANETRTVSQVVLPDAKAAQAFAAKLAGGVAFAKAAQEAGFAANDTALGTLSKAQLATATSPQVADAVFALKNGGTTAPVKTALGFSVDHVDGVTAHAARSLEQVRGDIAADLSKKKRQEAVGALVGRVQDALNDGASFADLAARQKLQVVTTPPLLADGTAPSDPAFKPDATLQPLLRVVKDMTPDDQATLEQVSADGRYALVGVASLQRAAPIPLAQARSRVSADMIAARAADRAKAKAQAILAKVAGGQPMAAAFAAAKLPAPQPVKLTQVQLAQANGNVPPALRTLFRLAPGKTELVPGPGGGWAVVRLDAIVPGDRAALPAIVAATRSEFGRNLSEEYLEEFATAARGDVSVKRNPAAVAGLSRQLAGAAPDLGQ